MFHRLLAATAAVFLATSAQAALISTITGTAGAGFVTWSFSGSATAGASGFFDDNDSIGEGDAWNDVGDFTAVANTGFSTITGAASLTIDGVTRSIDHVYIDTDGIGGAPLDEWGVGVDGVTNFLFTAGSVLSWTGSITVSGLDISDLSEGGVPSIFASNTYGQTANALAGELRIGDTAAVVPLPAGLPLLAAGLGGLALMRRRRRA